MRKNGFSMIELSIAVAIVALLSVAILIGARYLVGESKQATALKLVDGLREAGRTYSKREKAGLSFAGLNWTQASCPGTPPGVLAGLKVDCSYKTPWDSDQVAVEERNDATNCSGSSCMRVCLEIPSDSCATVAGKVSGAFAAACTSSATPADKCSLGGTGPWLVIDTR